MRRNMSFAVTLPMLCLILPCLAAAAQAPDTAWVTVDGHRMHLLVSGTRGPTVVLESGASSTHRTWTALQARLALVARVVSYDRPGLGVSDSCSRPRSARVIAEELRSALREAGLAPPFVLVGWSLGGAFVRVFASMYPTDVVGIVLVDPVQEAFYPRAEREQPALFNETDSADVQRLAAGPQGDRAEMAAWDLSLKEASASDSALVAPVILLSSSRADLGALGPIWTDEHRRWSERLRNVRYLRIDGVGHAIHRARPDDVFRAIQELRGKSGG